MQKLKLVIILFLAFFTNSFADNWVNISIPGYTEHVNDIHFINETTGFVSGEGKIWKTTNQGISWLGQTVPATSINYGFIRMASDSVGYAGGNIGYFIKTTNGGNNWIYNYIPGADDLNNIYCISENEVIVMGTFGRLFRTSNGGENWINISVQNNVSFREAVFKNKYGYMVSSSSATAGYRTLWESSDNGFMWELQTLERNIVGRSIQLTGTDIMFLLGIEAPPSIKGIIGRSTNFGKSWSFQYFPDAVDFDFSAMDFSDREVGYCLESNDQSAIYKTLDTGKTWQRTVTFPYFLNKIECTNLHAFAGGDSGKIYKTEISTVGIESLSLEVSSYQLKQNYPNPFNPETSIEFSIPKAAETRLNIYDSMGREIAVLIDKTLQRGEYRIKWNAQAYPSGIYFYSLSLDGKKQERKKMVLIK